MQKEIEYAELNDLIDDGAPSSLLPTLRPNRNQRPSNRTQSGRLLPRTRASERVRARITRSRQQRAAISRQEELEQGATIDAIAVSLWVGINL